ncbi:MAG: hypothetical protein AB7S38_15175 [Vulcanimicrobiota bacterium]
MPYITSVERMGMERGLAEGHEKGLAEGLEKGIEAGHARGVRDSIRTVLAARFGEGFLEQLGGLEDVSDSSQLSSLTLAAVSAVTFEDFLTALSATRSLANEA